MFGTEQDIFDYYNKGTDKYKCCVLQYSWKCNLNCECCFVADFLKKSDFLMEPKNLEKVVKYCAENDYPMYTGSCEPMAVWDYTRDILIPMVKKYNAKLIVSSNGLWGSSPKIIKEVIDSKIDMLFLSVDSFHKVPYTSIKNILTAFKDVEHTKVFIMTIKDYRVPIPYDDEVFIHEFIYGKQYDDEQILFTHNKNGEIVYVNN